MTIKDIPKCWCKNPISLSCIRYEHVVPCQACAGSMAPGERAARVMPGTFVRCKRCHAGNTIFAWDHDGAMAWLDANKHIRKNQGNGEGDSDTDSPQDKGPSQPVGEELGALLKLEESGMSSDLVRQRAIEILDSLDPMYAELRQALRCVQDPKKIRPPSAPNPMRSTMIMECVSIFQPYLSEGEEELVRAFEDLQRQLLRGNPHDDAVSALTRLTRCSPGAFNTHVHVLDLTLGPYARGRAYTPEDAPFEKPFAFNKSLSQQDFGNTIVLVKPSL
ncbi:hypothetical protein BDV06DRAFT_219199 [Aspergillus oleicola]